MYGLFWKRWLIRWRCFAGEQLAVAIPGTAAPTSTVLDVSVDSDEVNVLEAKAETERVAQDVGLAGRCVIYSVGVSLAIYIYRCVILVFKLCTRV